MNTLIILFFFTILNVAHALETTITDRTMRSRAKAEGAPPDQQLFLCFYLIPLLVALTRSHGKRGSLAGPIHADILPVQTFVS